MAELLSQSQIDELLGLAKSNKADAAPQKPPEPKDKKYDFHSPKKFNKDRLKLLNVIYANYARVVSSHVTSMLRMNCEAELIGIEELRYYEFNNALSDTDILSVVEMELQKNKPDEPIFLVQLAKPCIMGVIDKFLGGDGESSGVDDGEAYTDIELTLYEMFVEKIMALTPAAWENYVDIRVEVHRTETNPRLVQAVSFDEVVVLITINLTIGTTTGTLNICLPSELLSAIFDIFERDSGGSAAAMRKAPSPEATESLTYNIKATPMEITACLGKTQILVSDLYSLNVGDVINLNKPKDSDVTLQIGDKPWFTGKLGVFKQNKAVKVNGIYEESNQVQLVGGEI